MQPYQSIRRFCSRCKKKLASINTFESTPPSDDPHTLHNQKLSTWLFIPLLCTLITVLLLYNILAPIQKTFMVQKPSYDQYLDLFSQYSNNLKCPCRKVSVTYTQFLELNYTLISLCSSFLVSDEWIQYLAVPYSHGVLPHDDFRAIDHFVFQALRALCQLTNETIQNGLKNFYHSQYVSADLTAVDLFRQQNEAQIRQFISSSTETFLSSLKLVRQTTQANALLAATQTNYELYIGASYLFDPWRYYPVDYSGCSCAERVSCFAPAVIFRTNRNSISFVVPGFYTGCFVIEALLVSTLQCFYDEQCFNNITYYVNSTSTLNVTALNASMSTTFTPNSTVKEMIDQLMVERWSWNITFAKYFGECEPSQCTYTVGSKNDVIFIVTTVFGLVGGLVTILRIVVPRLVDYLRSRRSDDKAKTGEL